MNTLEKIVSKLQKELDKLEKIEKKHNVQFYVEKRLIKNAISKLSGRGQVKLSARRQT